MTRLYALYAAMIAVALLGLTHWQAYRSGKAACESSHREAVLIQQSTDQGRVTELVKSDTKREVRYVEKIRIVEQTVDDCIDRRMPADILDVLGGVQQRNSGPPQPRTPETLPTPRPPG